MTVLHSSLLLGHCPFRVLRITIKYAVNLGSSKRVRREERSR